MKKKRNFLRIQQHAEKKDPKHTNEKGQVVPTKIVSLSFLRFSICHALRNSKTSISCLKIFSF